ncbi:MAG TPA: AAA family ATPase, partial [Flavitalea sp.]|nr:AAA family ATPase [Flavitalea sp.]
MAKRVNRIITFYSYKGGVGRSMALANVAAALAKWDYKTLVIDWDLEAPGLENYFTGYLDLEKVRIKSGVIDLLRLKLNSELVQPGEIHWGDYINEINIGKTPLHLISAGKRDEEYIEKVRQFDYISFYQSHNGGEYLENLREHWLDQYDLVLIDSRTGLTDSSGICSIHMPDILVLMFTPNEQSFYGVTEVARKAVEGQ